MPNCEYCDKPLVAIGTARGNGKSSHGTGIQENIIKNVGKNKKTFLMYIIYADQSRTIL